MEVWKDIKGYEGVYRVSDMGAVWSVRVGRRLSPQRHRSNSGVYLRVRLSINGVGKYYKIHRLVAQAFIPNPDNKPQVNHKNENTLSNYASNLEWVTNKENANWGTRNDRISAHVKGKNVGSRGRTGKNTNGKVYKLSDNQEILETYSYLSLVEDSGYSIKAVQQAIRTGCRSSGFYWSR